MASQYNGNHNPNDFKTNNEDMNFSNEATKSRDELVQTIAKMLDNLQNILATYKAAFAIALQSLSNNLDDGKALESFADDARKCLNVQDLMWKDLLRQKLVADSELANNVQNIERLQQRLNGLLNESNIFTQQPPITSQFASNFVAQLQSNIQPSHVDTFPILPNNPNANNFILSPFFVDQQMADLHSNDHNHSNEQLQSALIKSLMSGTEDTAMGNTNGIDDDDECDGDDGSSHHSDNKRKRRGYNGPYSDAEKQFIVEYQPKQTMEDIIDCATQMESRFKVKRSPYGLAQKMYQMKLIDSRLKAAFQRNKSGKHTNDSVDTDSKRRPFTNAEMQYIVQLIDENGHEQPRQLYWRFMQRFTDWENDSKSYQKFYHKHWSILQNQKKATAKKSQSETAEQ